MKIRPATPQHAPEIAEAIITAITPQLAEETFAGSGASVDDIKALFEELAARDDSQYSYLNTIVAEDDNGEVAGLIIGYDGAKLRLLRDTFLTLARKRLGIDFSEGLTDETTADEFYLDTLAVKPAYRRQGVGTALLHAAVRRAEGSGKNPGMLVDKDNTSARRLYESLGFRYVGDRFFFGEMMDHLSLRKA